MANVDFNMDTLTNYQNDPDDLKADLANTCLDDFKKYGKIVTTFDDQMNTWKQEKTATDYKQAVAKLDHDRRLVHDNCLNDINIINRMAKKDGIKPFVICNDPNPNRTDIGNAIIAQCYENIQKAVQPVMKTPQKANNFKDTRQTVNDYNFMLGYTKYPLVHDKDNHYHFINMFTQETIDTKQVEAYTKSRTKQETKIKLFSKACDLVQETNPKKDYDFLPKADTNKIKSPANSIEFSK